MASIQHRPELPHPYIVRWANPDAPGKQRQRSFKALKEAKAFRSQIEVNSERVLPEMAGAVLFRRYAEDWFNGKDYSIRSRETVAGRLNTLILPFMGAVPVNRITVAQVKRYVTWLRNLRRHDGTAYAAGTQRAAYKVMATILHAAEEDGLIVKVPLPRKPELPSDDAKDRQVFLARREVAQILSAFETHRPRHAAMPRLGYRTGMRIGEIIGLRWENVDLFGRVIHVREQLVPTKGGFLVTKPKFEKVRSLQIDVATRDVLLRHRTLWGEGRGGYVFFADRGGVIRPSSWRQRIWDAVIERCGIDFPVKPTMHDLRHTHASELMLATGNLLLVSRRLGHASITITADTYGHLQPKHEDRALDLLARWWEDQDLETRDEDGMITVEPPMG